MKTGNKEIKVIGNMMFYGQNYNGEFQVLESAIFSDRKYKNWIKKYGL